MAGPTLAHLCRYAQPSSLSGPELRLATSDGAQQSPHFFSGTLARPRLSAQCLRTLSRVVQARYHVPAAMLDRILALADPIVTSGAGMLRFEGFSSCASVYCRMDLVPEAFAKVAEASPGTTNVDFNGEMRAALSGVRDGDPLALSVGAKEVIVESGPSRVVERKVPLPVRWLKGLVEVQAYQAAMSPRFEVAGPEAVRFLRSLPRSGTKHPGWVVASGRTLRLSQREAPAAARVVGIERLRPLEDLAVSARKMRCYADERNGASAWELDLEIGRFVLVLSPEVWRGFSGEGQALAHLASQRDEALIARARASLKWQQRIDLDALAREWSVAPDGVAAAMSALGARGLVGYDLALGSYFHRELPFDMSLIEALQPRLVAARKIVSDGVVALVGDGEATVAGTGVTHRVRFEEDPPRCTCPWFARHQGMRGPCKHVLAAQILAEEREWGSQPSPTISEGSSKRGTSTRAPRSS